MNRCLVTWNKQGIQPWGQQQQVKKYTRNKHNTAMILNFQLSLLALMVLCTMKKKQGPLSPVGSNSKSKTYKEKAQYSYVFNFLACIARMNGCFAPWNKKDPSPGGSNSKSIKRHGTSTKPIWFYFFYLSLLVWMVLCTMKQARIPALRAATAVKKY